MQDQPTSSGLIIGIILGILILGGIFLYVRGNTSSSAPDDGKASLDVNVKMPTTGGDDAAAGN